MGVASTDVVSFATFSAFPATGTTGKLYEDLSDSKKYVWNGTTYIESMLKPVVGVATLDSAGRVPYSQLPSNLATLTNGKVPASQLPSYVDDVMEIASYEARPIPGESGKLYVALDTNFIYRWSGSDYIEVSSAGIADVAVKLLTPRTISLSGSASGSVSFDGSSNVNMAVTLPTTYSKSEIDTKLNLKANSATTLAGYNISDAYTTSQVYTKTEVDNAISTKSDVHDTLLGYGIKDAYTKDEVYNKSEVDSIANNKVNSGKTKLLGTVDPITGESDGYGITDGVRTSQLGVASTEVLSFANFAAFPLTATASKLYVDSSNNKHYTWNGTTYVESDLIPFTGVATLGINGKVTQSQLPFIPTKVSDITNDLEFQTATQVSDSIVALTGLAPTIVADLITLSNQMAANEAAVALAAGNINSKANVATTLAGYGITDAYTKTETYNKTEIDELLVPKANVTDVYTQSEINAKLATKQDSATTILGYGITDAVSTDQLGVALGIATLDSNGMVPTSQLPSFVDDVLEYADLASFPTSNVETGKIYVALDTNKIYRWSGSVYVEVSSAGIADSALKLTHARTISLSGAAIGSVSFDGSADVTLDVTLPTTYSKLEVDTLLAGKVNSSSTLAGYNIGDAYTKTEIDTTLANKATKSTTLAGYGITDLVDLASAQILTNKTLDMPHISSILEKSSINASTPSTITNIDVKTSATWYYTANTNANFTVNLRGSSSVTLDSLLAVGDSVSITLMITNGAVAYMPSAISIDGTNVTPKWIGGAVPSAGNASSIDMYSYVVIKTAANTYTVMASQSKFA